MLELGIDAIWRQIRAVQQPLLDWAAQRADVVMISDVAGAHRSGILCFRPPRVQDVHRALLDAGVFCSLREGAIRLSPHFYNTVDEMERVVALLEATLVS